MNGHDSVSISPFKRAPITAAIGNTAVVAAVPGKRIRVAYFYLRQAAAGTVEFEDAAGGTSLTGVMTTTTADLVVEGSFNPVGHFETSPGNALNLALATAAGAGWLVYQEIG